MLNAVRAVLAVGAGLLASGAPAGTAQNLPPAANASVSVLAGLSIAYDGSASADPDGTVVRWTWDFGDGSAPVSGIRGTRSYGAPGTYRVALSVEDDGGAAGTDSVLVTVGWSAPLAAAPAPLARPLLVGLRDGTTQAFENTGLGSPVWTRTPGWDVADIGDQAAPALGDLDGDGDYDLLLGENLGVCFAYRNTGAGWSRTAAWDSPDVGGDAVPTFGDLDGDGDLDLVIGRGLGFCNGYRNTGSASAPAWTRVTAWDVGDVGGYADPCLGDLDGDGDLDLLVGDGVSGKTIAFRNTGSRTSPIWTARAAWDVPTIGAQASPGIEDLDGDGDLDLLVGTQAGTSLAFQNTGSRTAPVWTRKAPWDVADLGTLARPAFRSPPRAGLPYSVGVFRQGPFFLDENRNGAWDGAPPDRNLSFGSPGDVPVTGDWTGTGTDRVGVFRDGLWRLDVNDNGVWDGPATDRQYAFGVAGDRPVVGDWNGDGRDDLGIVRSAVWSLDMNGNGAWDGPGVDKTFPFGLAADLPISGDWNGDGKDDVGLFGRARWFLDLNGNFRWDSGIDGSLVFGLSTDRPAVGDWNRDGPDNLGVLRDGVFLLDLNGNRVWDDLVLDRKHPFGIAGDLPAVRVP